MPTREGAVTGVLAVAVFLLATNLASGLMFVLDAMLASLLAVGAATSLVSVRGLAVRRLAPPRVIEGADVPIDVTVATGLRAVRPRSRYGAFALGGGPRWWSVEDGWDGARGRSVVPVTTGTPAVACTVVVPAARRGRVTFGPIVIGSRGALGLFAARRRFAVPGEITVWPRTFPLTGAALARFAVVDEGTDAQRARSAADFHGLRDYQPGDALARIHWRSTIRRGAPVVREFEQPTAPGTTIVIDLDRRQTPARLDALVRATASLLHHLMVLQRRPVTVVGWTETPVEWRAWEAAMDWLAGVAPSGPPVGAVLGALPAGVRDVIVVASSAAVAPPPGGIVVAPFEDLAGTAPLRGHLTYDADGRVSAW
jgi:uncharacterized protein (DUF58 family)